MALPISPQFGIRSNTVYQQNNVSLSGVYEEQDGTCNPLDTGDAGLIVEGGQANVFGSNPSGAFPAFANTGDVFDWYYIVVHSSHMDHLPRTPQDVPSSGNACLHVSCSPFTRAWCLQP